GDIDSRNERDARIEGTFCGGSPLTAWTETNDPRGPRKAQVLSRRAFVRLLWAFAVINAKFDIPNACLRV
ncbi:hypothetical protein K0M31_010045, partial [Melipona bicolor]